MRKSQGGAARKKKNIWRWESNTMAQRWEIYGYECREANHFAEQYGVAEKWQVVTGEG